MSQSAYCGTNHREASFTACSLPLPNAERIFFIRHALRAGFTLSRICLLTKIDRWFRVQIKEIVDFEEELAGAKN